MTETLQNLILIHGDDVSTNTDLFLYYKRGFLQKYPNGNTVQFEEKADFHQIEQTILTDDLFGGRSLLILRNFFEKTTQWDDIDPQKFRENIQMQDKNIVLVLEKKLDKRKKSSKWLLQNAGKIIENKLPEKSSVLLEMLEMWTKKQKLQISPSVLQFLIEWVGINPGIAKNELRKLQLYAQDETITKEMIQKVCVHSPASIIWDLTEAFSQNNKSKSIDLFQKIIKNGASVYEILPLLHREIRLQLLVRYASDRQISSGELCKRAKINPFVYRKTAQTNRNFSRKKLVALQTKMIELEEKIKNGFFSTTTNDTREIEFFIERIIIKACQ